MRKPFALVLAAVLLAGGVAGSAEAQSSRESRSRGDQASAREEMLAGRTLSSREIERRVIPQMKGQDYLGFEYDAGSSAYRLKFMKEGQVTWVDVDARSGRVLRVSR